MALSGMRIAIALASLTIVAGYAASSDPKPSSAAHADSRALDFAASGRPLDSVASRFVQGESPDRAFAFAPAAPGSGGRPVIAHYVPLFRLTIGKRDSTGDYYEREFLRAEGVKGKYARGSGFVRERPLIGPRTARQSQTDFQVEVARASRIGIDAIGVLLNRSPASITAFKGLADAASATDPRARIALEPDMISYGQVDSRTMASALLDAAGNPAVLRDTRGRLIVMPFAPERRDAAFWSQVAAIMARSGEKISLVPDFVDSSTAGSFSAGSTAAALWGDRNAGAGERQSRFGEKWVGRGYPAWVATAAPQDMRPKTLITWEAEGSLSFQNSLRAAIDGKAAALHLVTWNDYSEGSEIAPSSGTRFAYYDLAAYYIAWFKAGVPPRIVRDAFLGFHRNQLFRPADRTRGAAWRVRGGKTVDIVEMTAFLTAPAELEITSGGKSHRQAFAAGLQRFTAPAAVGPVTMRIVRSGRAVIECQSPWRIEEHPSRHDPLYRGFSSLRGCR